MVWRRRRPRVRLSRRPRHALSTAVAMPRAAPVLAVGRSAHRDYPAVLSGVRCDLLVDCRTSVVHVHRAGPPPSHPRLAVTGSAGSAAETAPAAPVGRVAPGDPAGDRRDRCQSRSGHRALVALAVVDAAARRRFPAPRHRGRRRRPGCPRRGRSPHRRGRLMRVRGRRARPFDQMVTVGDEITGSVEQLAGLIEIAADIQPGDSGGPLVDTAGKVIGVDTAGTTGPRTAPSAGAGLAIPINDAIGMSKQIRAGSAAATIHVGATGVLGLLVQGTGATAEPGRHARLGYRHRPAAPGVIVTDVVAGSPAQQAGLAAGSVLVSLDARRWTPPTRSSLRFRSPPW